VVALVGGNALGGGLELCLACHHRIGLDDPHVQVGFPEVQLGLIPGAGGTQRLPRLLGIQRALELIVQARVLRAPAAREAGLLDDLAPNVEEMNQKALAWIREHPGFKQPWDRADFTFPPPAPSSNDARDLYLGGMALLYKKTAGAFPAAETAFRVIQEGCRIRLEGALELESRAFAGLAASPAARDMVRTFFFHKNAADRLDGLPSVERSDVRWVGILGAGMMGAGLAWLAASRGFDVVLRDIDPGALERARVHAEAMAREARHLTPEARASALGRLRYALDAAELKGCDLVIEAVFESLELKHRVLREVEPLLASHAILASNTSALPIDALAAATDRPEHFLGLHFFSPVERMPLIEVIRGSATSEATLARALRFGRELRKTPIVVNDGYGFYTTRVFSSYILEGAQLVTEGHASAIIEWAARSAGMAVPPLQVFDEISLKLGKHVLAEARRCLGDRVDIPGARLVFDMVDVHERPGRAAGKGFYAYERGRRLEIWPGLTGLFPPCRGETGVEYARKRLMLAQVAEVARAWDEGILVRERDAELGAVLGLGFCPNTGGPLAFMDRWGIPALVRELDALAACHGSRYEPAPLLRRMAEEKRTFYDDV
jgi:3-hydroxyacyl-CoA dehydrogenase/enoyl-CoA hydratase/3-hydroxybutyryl-CoA epimerase